MKSIDLGYTKDHLIGTVLLLFIGFILVFFFPLVGLALIISALPFILTKKKFEVDSQSKRVRIQKHLFNLIKWGQWYQVNDNHICVLQYRYDVVRLSSRGSSSLVKTKTFSLKLENRETSRLIYEFVNYKKARKSALLLVNTFNMLLSDAYSEALKGNKGGHIY